MRVLTESQVEEAALEILERLGYGILHGPDIAPDGLDPERQSYSDVVLQGRLQRAIDRLNPEIPPEARRDAIKQIVRIGSPDLIENNRRFHKMLAEGVDVEYRKHGRVITDKIWLFDFKDAVGTGNEFVAVNQFTIIDNNHNRRPDIILFVNGLPIVVIELKNPADENATAHSAFKQLETYKLEFPTLFNFNEILVVSDGFDAKAGTITSEWGRFLPWKTIDGKVKTPAAMSQIEVILKGMLNKETLLDLVRHFVVFEKENDGRDEGITISKKIAAYHQYHAVNKAIEETLKAANVKGDKRCGVVWHTQGSGKSLSMVFYTGKLVLSLDNPTIVVLTDRNDLDDQLYGTFSRCEELLRQAPVQADSRARLREVLQVSSGGIIFTTIQKFFPETKGDIYPCLSERRNIVVIADEAHRSQYDFIKGFAKHMRDALPNASFIGFTGTPVELRDKNTRAVFGDYIDIYDIEQSVEDGSTVRIYYESRLATLELKSDERPKIDPDFEEATEGEEVAKKEKLKSKWARLEAIVGSEKRIGQVARDIVNHFEERLNVLEGKAMIVCMSRRIAVDLHQEIVKLRPHWYHKDDDKGVIKVIMTGSADDGPEWQEHIRNKKRRWELGERMKDVSDPLKLVIVRDMWLTGFDVPSLHTMYIDKPMRGHGLMQAIARVNRVFKDKKGGVIVDYLGIADDLKKALVEYTESGGKGRPAFDQEEAVALMLEKYEVICDMFKKFDYRSFFTASVTQKMSIIVQAQEHILEQKNGKDRLLAYVTQLSQAFALSVPHEAALKIRDDVGFFQAVRARLVKYETGSGKTQDDIDSAIKQIISKAVTSDKVIDIFAAAGIKKPDISILSDEFLAEVKGMPHKNLAFELLKKLLNDEIKVRSKRNLVQGRSFAEMLESAIQKYQSKSIETARIIEELIELAKKMREADKRGEDLGLSEDELAFYDALEVNDSAVKVLGDDILRVIARELVKAVRNNVRIDWTLKESVQAKLRVMIKRILRRYDYPPDKEQKATETVLEQATLLCKDWAGVAASDAHDSEVLFLSDIVMDDDLDDSEKFVHYLPVYSLEAVATSFGKEEVVDIKGWKKIEGRRLGKELFIARVVGKSMEPTIPDGRYCLFRVSKAGSRSGLIVLAESHQVSDPETSQRYTIKRYFSEKIQLADGSWRHKRIVLQPDNKDFKDIVLENVGSEDFRIVAEFVDVL